MLSSELEKVLNQLTEKRQNLKKIASERCQKLKKSKEFFEFKNQCDDLNAWINERRRHAQATSSAEQQMQSADSFYLIEKHLNRHEALEKEMNANRTRLENLKTIASGIFFLITYYRCHIQFVFLTFFCLGSDLLTYFSDLIS